MSVQESYECPQCLGLLKAREGKPRNCRNILGIPVMGPCMHESLGIAECGLLMGTCIAHLKKSKGIQVPVNQCTSKM